MCRLQPPRVCPNLISRYHRDAPRPWYQDIRPHTWAPEMPNSPEITLFFYPCRHHIKFSTPLDAGIAIYGLLCWIQFAAACDRPVGAHMVTYDLILYGTAAGLLGYIWSHMVPSPMARRPACRGSYGHIGLFSPVAPHVLTCHAVLTNHHH